MPGIRGEPHGGMIPHGAVIGPGDLVGNVHRAGPPASSPAVAWGSLTFICLYIVFHRLASRRKKKSLYFRFYAAEDLREAIH